VLVLLALAAAACGGPGAPERDAGGSQALRSADGRSNLLLVVFDTLGAEHVGHLGLGVPGAADSVAPPVPSPTPHLDALATRGVAFRRAYSPAPWTQPAVASLLTARMPSEHGLVRLFGRLGTEPPTLGERFRDAGWATAGVISHSLLEARFGLDRGFGAWDESPVGGHAAVTSDRVTEAALRWLDEDRPLDGSEGRPFLLLVHYFDPHFVYNHHPDHDRTAGYEGALRSGMGIWRLRDLRPSLTAADVGYLTGLYREEIAHTDAALGRLLAGLAERDLLTDTWVVATADHGEEFMRHGWIGHTRTLYDELLRVPLVIAPPVTRLEGGDGGGSGGRERAAGGGGVAGGAVIDEPVSLLDLAPPLVELLGAGEWPASAEASEPRFRPLSLAALVSAPTGASSPSTAASEVRRRLAERDLFAEVSFVQPEEERPTSSAAPARAARAEKDAFQTAIVAGPLKLIHDLAAGDWHLYDLAADPEELNDLAGTGHPAERGLRRRLLEWERSRTAAAADLLVPSDEERERLRALGYLR
jgi:arylsulfatase A-like enzyme